MSPKYVVLLPAALAAVSLPASAVPISISESPPSYSQNFDSIAASGTENTALPGGWMISESGSNANGTYAVSHGTATAGDTYSFGASGSTERALGSLQSGALVSMFGVSFVNDGAMVIESLTIAYTGEQWRLGAAGRSDRLDFQYSVDATSLSTGTWTDVDALDFSTPNVVSPGAKDGNAADNRSAVSSSFAVTAIPIGTAFWLRWTDFNASGADDGLAIDDFSLTATFAEAPGTAVPDGMPAGFAAAALLLALFLPRALERRPRS